jgi:rhodanese-related sulfurtransferase
MNMGIFRTRAASVSAPIGAAEFLKAKLDVEAAPDGLKAALETAPDTVLVVDVRPEDDFHREHILGATNIPAPDIVRRLAALPKDRTIVTYSWDMTCALAPRAALELARKGFTVQYLAGGIAEWRRKGYAVRRSP